MLAASDPASLPRLRDVPMPGLVLPLRRSNNRLNKPITITPRPARVIVCMYHGFAGTTGGGTGSGSGLAWPVTGAGLATLRSEEHTSELQSLMRISYAVFCLKKKKTEQKQNL